MIHKILTNNTLSALILGAVIVTVCILVLNFTFQSTMDGVEWREEIYSVSSGDSLWTISAQYCPDSVDAREWVAEIKALNGLANSTIYPGQRLIVLAPAE